MKAFLLIYTNLRILGERRIWRNTLSILFIHVNIKKRVYHMLSFFPLKKKKKKKTKILYFPIIDLLSYPSKNENLKRSVI